MTLFDSLSMAVYNLWSRKGRTLLNLLGVVLSCVMLTMTLAGTRGASEGMLEIINASDQTKQFMVISSPNQKAKVPAEATDVPAGVSEQRRPRIKDRLRKDWIRENSKRIMLDADIMAQLRAIPNMQSVVWQSPVRCQFQWLNPTTQVDTADGSKASRKPVASSKPRNTPGSLIGIRNDDAGLRNRLVVGEIPGVDDRLGVLVDEFTAYNLGYQEDNRLEFLIGQPIKIRVPLSGAAPTPLAGGLADLLDPEFLSSMKRVAGQLDQTDLSDEDKQKVRQLLKQLPAGSTDGRGQSDDAKQKASASLQQHVEIAANGKRTLVRQAIIRGVLKKPTDEDLFSFLAFTGKGSVANVYINHQFTEAIQARKPGFRGFYAVAGSINDVSHLRGVIDQVEAMGLRTRSAVTIVEKLATEVGKLKLAAAALALVILLVAAIGICNTMIIAVLERTPEFGIMKSLGAENRQILSLVLLEGLLTGLLGALVATAISCGLAAAISEFLRQYIEERLKGSFDQPVFRFTLVDSAIVFGVTGIVCTLASFVPARRAAKLNPIAAMRRT